jgi:phospholipid/cholesterol/gamma-HCH transport system substrate-binding protein
MDTHVNYTAVGLFVISLIAALTLSIIWLSAGLSLENYTTYVVYMQESVSGLSPDAPIEYNGVDVGTIESISLSRKDPHSVRVQLNIRSDTPITKGTVATLNSRGLTGITYLALKDTGTDLSPLTVLPGHRYPIIKTAPSLFLRIDTAITKLSTSFSQLSDSLQSLLDKENQRSFKSVLHNLDTLTTGLARNTEQMNTILSNTAYASRQFPLLFQSSLGAMQVLETETLPATNQMIANLNEVTHNLSNISAEIKQNPAVLLRGKQPQPLGPGEK